MWEGHGRATEGPPPVTSNSAAKHQDSRVSRYSVHRTELPLDNYLVINIHDALSLRDLFIARVIRTLDDDYLVGENEATSLICVSYKCNYYHYQVALVLGPVNHSFFHSTVRLHTSQSWGRGTDPNVIWWNN